MMAVILCVVVQAVCSTSGVRWSGIQLSGEFTFYGDLVLQANDELILSRGADFNIRSAVTSRMSVNEELRRSHAPAEAKPVLALVGESEQRLHRSTAGEYTDVGATCTTGATGNLNHRVRISGDVISLNSLGEYSITYSCDDSKGNQAVPLTRTVTVITPEQAPAVPLTRTVTVTTPEKAPAVPLTRTVTVITPEKAPAVPLTRTVTGEAPAGVPTLKLLGEHIIRFDPEGEDMFVDEGAICDDANGEDLSRQVVISGDVIRLSSLGTYSTLYECEDANGNSAKPLVRTLVVERPVPLNSWEQEYVSIGMEEPLVALVDSFGDATSVTWDSISVYQNSSNLGMYSSVSSVQSISATTNASRVEEDYDTGNTHEPLVFSSQFGYSSTTTTTHLHLA